MTLSPKFYINWLYSLEHHYGVKACEALACNLIHRSTLVNLDQIKNADIIDIHKVINAFEIYYEDREIPMPLFQWMLDFYQMTDYQTFDFTPQTNTLLATHYLLKILLSIPTEDGVPAWMRSVTYSLTALNIHPGRFMSEAEFFLEHLE